MRVTWWGGPHDGQEIDVAPGTWHVVVAEPLPPFDWRVDEGAPVPLDATLRTRSFPVTRTVSESGGVRHWFVWSER
jgi:hypothetical protein